MQHFVSKLLHEDGGRYQRVSCTQSGRRSRRQMMSTKATTLNSEQIVIKVLLCIGSDHVPGHARVDRMWSPVAFVELS